MARSLPRRWRCRGFLASASLVAACVVASLEIATVLCRQGLAPAFLGGGGPARDRTPSVVARHAETEAKKRDQPYWKRKGFRGRKLLSARERRVQLCDFTQESTHRGSVQNRGKRNHFHLLDRYIRRIDAVMPENMEHLVRCLSYKPNLELTTQTLRMRFEFEDVDDSNITADDVESFFAPVRPAGIIVGYRNRTGWPEMYAHFATNEECREARQHHPEYIGNLRIEVKYAEDRTWEKVTQWMSRGDDDDDLEAEEGGEEEAEVQEGGVVAGGGREAEAALVQERVGDDEGSEAQEGVVAGGGREAEKAPPVVDGVQGDEGSEAQEGVVAGGGREAEKAPPVVDGVQGDEEAEAQEEDVVAGGGRKAEAAPVVERGAS